jgi:hypothetical protein
MSKRPPHSQISDRAHLPEREVARQHLGDFVTQGSPGLSFIKDVCQCEDLTREALVILALTFSVASGIRFPRDFGRRRGLIIKWFSDNIEELRPLGTVIVPTTAALPPRGARRSRQGRLPETESSQSDGVDQ